MVVLHLVICSFCLLLKIQASLNSAKKIPRLRHVVPVEFIKMSTVGPLNPIQCELLIPGVDGEMLLRLSGPTTGRYPKEDLGVIIH